jgi:hypothetical protein
MAVTNFSPLLGLALPTTGDLSGTWGTTVNDAITSLIDSAVAGTTTLSADADVTLSTTNGAANQARNAVILWTASNGATTRNITAPAQSKAYLVINAGTGSVVIRGSGPTTGVTVASGVRALVAWNGSDFVKIVSNPVGLTTDVSGILPIANGGTGTTSTTFTNLATNVTGTLPIANGGTNATTAAAARTSLGATTLGANVFTITNPSAITFPQFNADNTVSALDAASFRTAIGAGSGTGTVTSVAATVPSIFSIAGSPITTSGTLAITYSGTALPIANGGTGATTLAGANIAVVNVANTFTGTQTFAGTSSNLAEILTNAAEIATISATAATGTINYDVTTQSVLYYTTSASANWTVNFRASSGTSLNTAMTTGQSVTAAFLVTQGATAYYNNVVQVDGSTVTPKYQGGTAYAAGNASSVDVYMYTIIKTGNAAFTVFTSQTKFA